MASLLKAVRTGRRSHDPLSFADWLDYFTFNGGPFAPRSTLAQPAEDIQASFVSYVQQVYHTNGVVFACMAARQRLFSEARFQFRYRRRGRPGDLFGGPELRKLETPWPNGTTGDLLTRMEQDTSLAGNFYAARHGPSQLRRLRPDWVQVVSGSRTSDDINAPDCEIVGYVYTPGGLKATSDAVLYLPEQIAHFAPIPDPMTRFVGMSWLAPIIRDVIADNSATTHKQMFFQHGATPNLSVSFDPSVKKAEFEAFVEKFNDAHEGVLNAYKTLFVGGGAKVEAVGSSFAEMELKITQGHGETRIAAAAGIPPVIVGLSEGLAAATYSNYGQARRAFADLTARPWWRGAAAALEPVVAVPGGAELWYDDRDISFLQEDQKDAADIQQVQAVSTKLLVDAGFTPESVVKAIAAGDLTLLEHTGLFSVQLQPPGTVQPPGPALDAQKSLQLDPLVAALLQPHRQLPQHASA